MTTNTATDALLHKGSGLQVVVGLGQSGLSVARYLANQGYQVAVTDAQAAPSLADQLPAEINIRQFGAIDAELLQQAARIIISPGISLATPAVAAARQAGIPVVSDIQLFCDACTVPIVAITGSNAKSTVTTLVGKMAEDAGINVGVGGNIGVPALTLLDNTEMELAVLELSSFQLETVSNLGAQVATVLNMSPDHLDRHGDMLGYHQAKHRIFQGAKSVVINREDALTRPLVADNLPRVSTGIHAPDKGQYGLITDPEGQTYLARGTERLLSADKLLIKGRHNLLNAQAALALGELAGLPLDSMLNTLQQFTGLAHRCEYVANTAGIDYFNDSKGTNIGSTMAAIEGLGAVYAPKDGKLLLILGGQGKGQEFGELTPFINQYVSQVLFIGEDAQLIEQHLRAAKISADVALHQCQTLENAFATVAQVTSSSLSQVQAVLLSPACASFDQYSGYAARGEHFSQLVSQLESVPLESIASH
ncbi:UDP-N-acetylmuramoyl-L-alanine--D-glutamate ligase [Psychrobacter sp. APC 3426]|uniref:UDP-N-acetylmuramoyl-L-alanine--D-glutamate ligase n=1 Tax=Psychrobacter sp. APC 3426 TaxID=3035177 RepID=UPI0025B44A96|nr:UDP-N-acetylmuramoyl-L-alanine--D-glutamate ligase [Psychrobacter sp. APC 3426]MDN3397853.1 UDP-N-acetylmuramoyl-L-alanine--D-glutamate ligase [Psychrobacter sp. APC 3426]